MQTLPFISPSTSLTVPMKPTLKAAIFLLAAFYYALFAIAPAYAGGMAGATRQNPNTRSNQQTAQEDNKDATGEYHKKSAQQGLGCGEPPTNCPQGEGDPACVGTANRGMYVSCPSRPDVPPPRGPSYVKDGKIVPITFRDWNPIKWAPLTSAGQGQQGGGGGGGGGGGANKKFYWLDPAVGRGGNPGDVAARTPLYGVDSQTSTENVSYKTGTGNLVPPINAGKPMVNMGQEPQTTKDKACANRIHLVQSSMQYILHAAADAGQQNWRKGQRLVCNEDENKPGEVCSMENHCQSMVATRDSKEEYPAGKFIAATAKKVMVDASKGMDGGQRPTGTAMRTDGNMFAQARHFLLPDAQAAAESDHPYESFLPDPIRLENTQDSQQLVQKLEKVRINDLRNNCGPGRWCKGVWDPGDAWSPRWYTVNLTSDKSKPANERDEYSPTGKIYSQFEKDNVVCAGGPTKNNKCKSPNAKGADQITKVDLIGSRKDKSLFPERFQLFDKEIKKRLNLNVKCWRDQLGTICWKKPFCVVRVPCWVCFFGSQKKTGTVNEGFLSPPCSTDHQNFDRPILKKFCPNFGNPNVTKPRHLKCKDWPTAPSLCAKLRAPLQMINTLEVRMNEPSDKKHRYPNGISQGDDFSSKYGCRMPYPVQQDTGTPVHAKDKRGGQDPWEFNGATAAITSGVAHVPEEGGGQAILQSPAQQGILASWRNLISSAHAQGAGGAGAKAFNVTNKYNTAAGGGWGKDQNGKEDFECMGAKFKGGYEQNQMFTAFGDNLREQAESIRLFGMNCMPLRMKLWASGTAEGRVASLAGGRFEWERCTECDDKGNCTTCGAGGGGATGGSGGQKRKYYFNRPQAWPLAYRGTPCTKGMFDLDKQKPLDKRECFPFVGAKKEPQLQTGMDQARQGCVALLHNGGGKIEDSDTPGKILGPTLGYIRMIHTTKNTSNSKTAKDCSQDKNCHVVIDVADDGFFPTASGRTNHWGFPGRVQMMKDEVPQSVSQKLKQIAQENKRENPSDTCEEPQYGMCKFESWQNVPIYCPDEDVREEEAGA